MAQQARPLSPHLQIYKWQLTSVLSILHRGTGVFLSLGALLLCIWLLAVSGSASNYAVVQNFCGSWFGQLLLAGWSYSLMYHLLNGIRHLGWDAGYGLDIQRTYVSGWLVVVLSVVSTVVIWIMAMRGVV